MTTESTPLPGELELLARAEELLSRAFAPYSNIHVACVVELEDGSRHDGVNVENASLGLTICAERNALFRAMASGAGVPGRREGPAIARVLFTSNSDLVVVPCGACRQVLAELAPRAVVLFGSNGRIHSRWASPAVLLPEAFDGTWRGNAP